MRIKFKLSALLSTALIIGAISCSAEPDRQDSASDQTPFAELNLPQNVMDDFKTELSKFDEAGAQNYLNDTYGPLHEKTAELLKKAKKYGIAAPTKNYQQGSSLQCAALLSVHRNNDTADKTIKDIEIVFLMEALRASAYKRFAEREAVKFRAEGDEEFADILEKETHLLLTEPEVLATHTLLEQMFHESSDQADPKSINNSIAACNMQAKTTLDTASRNNRDPYTYDPNAN